MSDSTYDQRNRDVMLYIEQKIIMKMIEQKIIMKMIERG